MQSTSAPSKPSIPSTPSMQISQPTSSSSDPTPAPAAAPSEASIPVHTENKTLDEEIHVQNDVSQSKPYPPLPQHLRERWILPEKEPIKPIRLSRDTDGNYTIVQDGSVAPIFYPPTTTPMMMNPMARPVTMFPMLSHPTPWPTQYQNAANVNSNMLPHNMMPQQQLYNPFYYP